MSEEKHDTKSTSHFRKLTTDEIRLLHHDSANHALRRYIRALRDGDATKTSDPNEFGCDVFRKTKNVLAERLDFESDD